MSDVLKVKVCRCRTPGRSSILPCPAVADAAFSAWSWQRQLVAHEYDVAAAYATVRKIRDSLRGAWSAQ